MLSFFNWSYANYVSSTSSLSFEEEVSVMTSPSLSDFLLPSASPERVRAESWLGATSLFAQAWGAALESASRAWWTIQIFPFATTWGLWLGLHGGKRCGFGNFNLAVFTALGFLVAISFAVNLSFLAVLVSPPPRDEQKRAAAAAAAAAAGKERGEKIDEFGEDTEEKYFIDPVNAGQSVPDIAGYFIVGLVHFAYSAASTPTKPAFAIPLALLHLNVIFAVKGMTRAEFFVRNPRSLRTMSLFMVFVTLFPFMARIGMLTRSGDMGVGRLVEAVGSHPAVKSVAWDVIMCWISMMTWSVVGDGS